jgi:hypothetical protein
VRTSWALQASEEQMFCLRTRLQPCRKGPLISGFSH